MSGFQQIDEAFDEIADRRDRDAEERRARRIAALLEAATPKRGPAPRHSYSPTTSQTSLGIEQIRAGCTCGWRSRRFSYTDRLARSSWTAHSRAVR